MANGAPVSSASRTKSFIYANVLTLSASGLALLWLSRDGRLDFAIAQRFFDATRGGFFLRDHTWLSAVGHDAFKWFALGVWLLMLTLALASFAVRRLKPACADLWWFCMTALAAALWVSWLKGQNAHACPWDIDVFGGAKPWYPLLGAAPIDEAGRCWPGGHAAGGFSLIAGYFAWRHSQPALARMWLVFSLLLGSLMSAAQIMRGAHFLSHNLWTLWWCALISLMFYAARHWRY